MSLFDLMQTSEIVFTENIEFGAFPQHACFIFVLNVWETLLSCKKYKIKMLRFKGD